MCLYNLHKHIICVFSGTHGHLVDDAHNALILVRDYCGNGEFIAAAFIYSESFTGNYVESRSNVGKGWEERDDQCYLTLLHLSSLRMASCEAESRKPFHRCRQTFDLVSSQTNNRVMRNLVS